MKKITPLLLLLLATSTFAQGEANNWFFGLGGGIQFSADGTVSPLFGGQVQTNEGCSTISDADGNLLFYTDGRNVWDRNHILMPNGNYGAGTGLLGDPSSTQSGIIVPKKGDPNIYYIFTVDEPHHENAAVYPAQFNGVYTDTNAGVPEQDDGFNNGFNYSVVDLSVTGANGSIGDVVTRNEPLVTYDPANIEHLKYKCSEKITAVKNSNNTGFWVITQFVDSFYAFEVTANGVNTTPVVTQIAPNIPTSGYRRNAIGYLKASPNGEMLAIAHNQIGTFAGGATNNGTVYLYNFDNATGTVSNPLQLANNINPYGLEFSKESRKLYVTYDTSLVQFDLEAANIPASEVFIASVGTSTGLQLGPNGKIYRSAIGTNLLDVINEPDENGLACDFVSGGVSLPFSMTCTFGLPPFITSFLSANIEFTNTCFGDVTEFSLDALGDFDSVVWDFGDGASSTDNAPQHQYAAPGIYTVIATITKDQEVFTATNEVTIHVVPVANNALTLTECDPDNNGVATFNLTANNQNILGLQNATEFEVKYYISQENADTDTSAVNATAFVNTSNPQTLFARVQNRANRSCFSTTSFSVAVSNTPVLNGNSFDICDDAADGDNTNGQAEFALDGVTAALVQDTVNFSTAYYTTQANAQAQTNALGQTFYNTVPNQQVIFARVVNNTNADCFSITPITLNVIALPPVVNNAFLVQCDLGVAPDGITKFNLTEADSQFTNGDPDLETAYYATEADAENDINEITGSYTNTSNPQTVWVRVTNNQTGCHRVLPLLLQATVNTSPAIVLETCDDDGTEDGLHFFDLIEAGIEDGVQTVVYYANATDALLEQNAIDTDYTNVTPYQQSVYARIENNNECTLLQEIKLIVFALPDIDIEDEAIVCNNTQDFIILTSGINVNPSQYSYLWSNGATTNNIMINQPGVYTVMVTNINGCEKLRTITVAPSDVAVIDDIIVEDLRDNNTITVEVSPTGGVNTTYFYSLDLPEGPFTESNVFENVTPGIHTVYVYDTNGCGIVQQEVAVLAIPKFFTPNGDGTNEFWNVIGIKSELYENSRIYIFDRYGKFIAGVNPLSPGWDGTYNGNKLPATDYWYVVNLQDGRTVKGHFSMVR
ncbi:T9SS type B sorting domain-containing protein [Flavobacterium sp. D11R37]|uniref:T9SS type B sorting domain-containing protein n=1 Tax=Flavobacterium coralii TaxID=2838017 RepID=UPI001CA685A3|nr:T9SS type B sorting domain-containing protein [Flavobacterium coralii]MBY8962622.1 T9SS type B sorting domain-containing protein [Flavobacterium coralii]